MSLGFILSRHVNSEKTNNYWKECIIQIRKFYPLNEIIVVDDNSNYEFIDNINIDLTNCKIIQSEYHQRAELLPYYYFYKLKPFEQAVILSDSTFIRTKFEDDNLKHDIKFLWSFHSYIKQDELLEKDLLRKLNCSEKIIELYNDGSKWRGCFSTLSIIKHEFLVRLVEKYNFFILLEHIKCRDDRMCLERVFGVICHYEDDNIYNIGPVFGDITDHYWRHSKYTYDNYVEDKVNNTLDNYNKRVVRVWTGR